MTDEKLAAYNQADVDETARVVEMHDEALGGTIVKVILPIPVRDQLCVGGRGRVSRAIRLAALSPPGPTPPEAWAGERTVSVPVRFGAGDLRDLDLARGTFSRSAFIRDRVLRMVVP